MKKNSISLAIVFVMVLLISSIVIICDSEDIDASAYTTTFNANGGSGDEKQISTETRGDREILWCTADTTQYFTAPEGKCLLGWSEDPNATSPSYQLGYGYYVTSSKTLYAVWGNEVAQVERNGSVIGSYGSLELAYQATQNGDVIRLLADISLSIGLSTSKDISLNLNGHSISSSNDIVLINVKEGALNITGQGSIVRDTGEKQIIHIGNTSSQTRVAELIVGSGITISSTTSSWGVVIIPKDLSGDHDAILDIYGTVQTSKSGSFTISGNGTSTYGQTKIIIEKGASLTNTDTSSGLTVYHPQAGELIIAGTLEGPSGLEIKSGTCQVTVEETALIKATASQTSHTANNNGNSTTGYSVAVVENSNYKGSPTFTMSKGTLKGPIALVNDNNADDSKKGSIVISGGNVEGVISIVNSSEGSKPKGAISITGGEFSVDPSAYVGSSYIVQQYQGKYYVGSPVTVTFDTQGGSSVASQTVIKGWTVTQPADPTKEGSFFDGWLTATGDEYDFSTPVAQDMPLYADWSDVTVEEDVEPYVDEEGNVGEKITAKATYIDGSTEETELIAVEVGDEARLSEETVFTDPKGNTITISSTGSVTRSGASIQITSGSIEGTSVSIAMAEIISGAAEESDAFELDLTVSTPAITIPSSLLDDKNISSVTFAVNSESENSARITVPAGALSLDSDHGAVALSVSSTNVSAPSNSRAVFELNIAGASTTFSEPVTVSYDVDIPSGASNIRAYCIDNGDSVEAVYSNGTVTFDLEHFSSWAIICDVYIDSEDEWEIQYILEQQKRAQEAAASQTTTGDDSGEEIAVIIAAAAVAGAMLACAFFAFRKNY